MLDHAAPSDRGRGIGAGLAACPAFIRRVESVFAGRDGLGGNRLDDDVIVLGRLLARSNGNKQADSHETLDSIRH
jgi:hypothetical protein